MRSSPHLRVGERYLLPEFPQELATARHPAVAAVEAAHDEWLTRCYPFTDDEQASRFLAQRSALWTAVTYPTTPEDRVHDLARLTSYLFAFDDLCLGTGPAGWERTEVVLRDSLAVLEGHPAGTAHGGALADIWTDMTTRMNDGQQARLLGAVVEFARGCFTEMTARHTDTLLEFDAYVLVRLERSLAAWIYFILTEYSAGVDLSGTDRAALDPLHRYCAEHLLFANDLFSFRAEHFAGDHVNAVCILTAGGATLQRAIDRTAGLVARKETQVATSLAAARVFASGIVCRYLEHLEYVISGNLRQARFAPRYHGTPAFIDQPITSGEITVWSDRTEFRALRPQERTEV